MHLSSVELKTLGKWEWEWKLQVVYTCSSMQKAWGGAWVRGYIYVNKDLVALLKFALKLVSESKT